MELGDDLKQSYGDSDAILSIDRQALISLIIYLDSLVQVIFGNSYSLNENDSENAESIERFCYHADVTALFLVPLQDNDKCKFNVTLLQIHNCNF